MKKGRVCELCTNQASLYCTSDAAFLCFRCDATVHQANFLVAAHVRQPLCAECMAFTGDQISGAGTLTLPQICQFCLPDALSDDVDSLSSSSACISSTQSCVAGPKRIALKNRRVREHLLKHSVSSSLTKISREDVIVPTALAKMKIGPSVDAKAEGIFMNWCRKLGVNGILVVPSAAQALEFCLGRVAALSFRVSAAVSLWLALRFCGDKSLSTCQNLSRLQEVSGVPTKLILAAEARLTRAVRIGRARRALEEGWAEC
ncbi:B-box zinc finger protein 32 [Corylus avellana]|uniref:B-box zinc finger protein 32 n=1 Tax=Corylus avellana TaxID=13451 RepID=UPI00286B8CA0|nr:B-box zinc finger protein 32 [Corylus avellana]